MPLRSGKSRKILAMNIATEREAGRPLKQAVAIALTKSRGGKQVPARPRKSPKGDTR